MLRFSFALVVCAYLSLQSIEARSVTRQFKHDVEYCLSETNLHPSDLGISSIDELDSGDLARIHFLPEQKRSCFMACWFKIQEIINEEGVINQKKLPEPISDTDSPNDFERDIENCKGKKNYCQVGGCLYEIYYL